LLYIGICCEILASLLLFKLSKEIEITGCEIWIVRTVVHNIPALAPQPIMQLVGSIWHSGFHFFGPHKVHKTDKQFAEDAHINHADTSWLHTMDTNF
jgi:hypothetical protein